MFIYEVNIYLQNEQTLEKNNSIYTLNGRNLYPDEIFWYFGGIRTVSMMWITPLVTASSGRSTVASFTLTPTTGIKDDSIIKTFFMFYQVNLG